MWQVRAEAATRLILIEGDPGASGLDPFDGLDPITVADVRQLIAGPPHGELLSEGGGDLKATVAGLMVRHHLTQLDVTRTDAEALVLHVIKVDPERRGEGHATAAMRELLAWVDSKGYTLALTPSSDFGASKARLAGWYRSLGFVRNKGRNKDWRFRETMVRLPESLDEGRRYQKAGGSVSGLRVLKSIVAPEDVMALNRRRVREGVDEGKAIGTALLKANVGERDRPLQAMDPSTIRRSIRRAGSNAPRALQRVYQEARLALPPIISRLVDGRLTLADAQLRSAVAIRRLYERMRQIGRRASGLRELGADEALFREEERWFRSAVTEELRYWNTFLKEVSEGVARNIPKRIDAYIDALRFMYEASRIAAMPDNTLLHWVGPRDERLCPGCAYLMEMSPFVKDNIPAVPRDGSTSCLTHCRHRIVVRVANNLSEVVRRRQQLPRRDEMVKELKRRQGRGGRTLDRPDNARARNPFHREGLTKRVSRPL